MRGSRAGRTAWRPPLRKAAPTLDIRLLGVPRVCVDGEPAAFRAPARAFALLAYVAIAREPVPRRRAAFALWPDHDEEAALANLRRHVALLESALPPAGREPWLRKDRLTLQWAGDERAVVDAVRFEVLGANREGYAAAVAFYHGDFLESLADDEWIVAHRDRLRDRQLAMLVALVADCRAAGDSGAALEYALTTYRLDPWREDALRDVMSLRRDLGDGAGALAEYRAFGERVRDELGVEPMPETVALAASIAERPARATPGQPAAAAAAPAPAGGEPPNNLPRETSGLIGRDELVASVRAAVAAAPVVTLVGTGGVGKTRAALRVASELLGDQPDGAWFVDLASVRGGALVANAVAAALGVAESKAAPILTTVVQHLAHRCALLVFDNCEHVVEDAAAVAAAIVRGCPGVRVLATSREALNVDGEAIYEVPPLTFPPPELARDVAAAATYDAVALFVERARASDARFRLSGANVADVCEICARLDGLPLAIELAAARVRMLGVRSIAERLNQRLDVLTAGRRERLERQQSLRALIDWSHDLLTERERALFRRLATFSGGWSLDAACEVCSDEQLGATDVVDVLAALAAKSLVVAEDAGAEHRFRFLESTREYALERLQASGEADALARGHLAYFLDLAERFEASWLTQTDAARCFEIVHHDLDNLRAALDWSFARRNDPAAGARLAVSCERLWTMALQQEGRRRLTDALDALAGSGEAELTARVRGVLFEVMPYGTDRLAVGERAVAELRSCGDELALARVLSSYGHLVGQRGGLEDGIAAIEEALTIARRHDAPRLTANSLALLAALEQQRGDLARAQELFAEAASLLEAVGSPSDRAFVLYVLAEIEFARGDPRGALARARKAHVLLKPLVQETRVLGVNASNMAAYAIAAGDLETASSCAREAIGLLRDMDDLQVWPIEHVAVIEALSGRLEAAAKLFGFTDAAVRRLRMDRGPTEQAGASLLLALLRRHFDDGELAGLTLDGSLLTPSEAAAAALAAREPRDTAPETQ